MGNTLIFTTIVRVGYKFHGCLQNNIFFTIYYFWNKITQNMSEFSKAYSLISRIELGNTTMQAGLGVGEGIIFLSDRTMRFGTGDVIFRDAITLHELQLKYNVLNPMELFGIMDLDLGLVLSTGTREHTWAIPGYRDGEGWINKVFEIFLPDSVSYEALWAPTLQEAYALLALKKRIDSLKISGIERIRLI